MEGVPPDNLVRRESLLIIWCGGRELNPQGLPHTLLRRARMPFRHPRKINLSISQAWNYVNTFVSWSYSVLIAITNKPNR